MVPVASIGTTDYGLADLQAPAPLTLVGSVVTWEATVPMNSGSYTYYGTYQFYFPSIYFTLRAIIFSDGQGTWTSLEYAFPGTVTADGGMCVTQTCLTGSATLSGAHAIMMNAVLNPSDLSSRRPKDVPNPDSLVFNGKVTRAQAEQVCSAVANISPFYSATCLFDVASLDNPNVANVIIQGFNDVVKFVRATLNNPTALISFLNATNPNFSGNFSSTGIPVNDFIPGFDLLSGTVNLSPAWLFSILAPFALLWM